jgi:hypothetical protein
MQRIGAILIALSCLSSVTIGTARAERVAILIALEPAKVSGKRWDIDAGADLVLCTREGCYRSNGDERSARFLPGKRALSPLAAISISSKAGACTNRLACVYRGVDLPASAVYVQPIDVDVDRHDRLEHRFIAPDQSCSIRKGELLCYRGAFTREYSMWAVPEELAAEAGPELIARAIEGGLAKARLAYAEEFLGEEREALSGLAAGFYRFVLGEGIAERCTRRFDVMAEAFALSGVLPRGDSEAASLLVDYLENDNRPGLLESIKTRPRAFWRLHDAINRLNSLLSAASVRHDDRARGVLLVETEGGVELVVGADVFEEARALIDRCEGRDETDLSSIVRPKKS